MVAVGQREDWVSQLDLDLALVFGIIVALWLLAGSLKNIGSDIFGGLSSLSNGLNTSQNSAAAAQAANPSGVGSDIQGVPLPDTIVTNPDGSQTFTTDQGYLYNVSANGTATQLGTVY